MSTLAVFLVIGGGTALAAFVITSNSQVAPGTISGHNPPSGDHPNIIADSINGQDVAPNRLGGGQINESTLSKVPNTDALDGINSTGFIKGSGQILTIDTSADANGSATLFTAPGFVRVDGLCGDIATAGNAGVQTFDLPVEVLSDKGGADADHLHVDANSSAGSSFWQLNPGGDVLNMSLQAAGGRVATVFIYEYTFHSPFLREDICKYQGHAIVSGA